MNSSLKSFISSVNPIIQALNQSGGTGYLVGGSVRDLVLNKPLKDFDIEVHNISIETLESILKKFGTVIYIGKKFGVLRILGFNIDWSLPRKDSIGRKPDVIIDPSMTIEHASQRRDLTMNAMAINLNQMLSNPNNINIIDPYNGLEDIKEKRLRAVDTQRFLEDPLRFYRVMQFIGRFEMQPDKELNTLCASMDLYDHTTQSNLASERIYEEIKKLFLLSLKPSLGFRWLLNINRLHDTFPELQKLVGVKQRIDYHPEGDVFEHTMQSLDASARFKEYQTSQAWPEHDNEKLLIMLGTLCHDLGKPISTDTQLHAYGHEKTGLKPTKSLLTRLTNNQTLIKAALKLVLYHMLPFQLIRENATSKSYKRLAAKLAPEITTRQLGLIALFDNQGRNGQGHEPLDLHHDKLDQFLHATTLAMVTNKPEDPILLGRHLLDVMPPGPKLGKLLDKAYAIQIDEGIKDWQVLKQKVLKP